MADRTHFIGIGGAGMSAIALVMHRRGACISGSDQRSSGTTDRLSAEGIKVSIGHDAAYVEGASLVVYSAAVPEENPELAVARKLGIPTVSRAEMLGRLMQPYRHRVAIAGTHGKTTTTSMVSLVLSEAGLDPTVLIGGDLAAFGGNVRVGGEKLVVTEACEAFDSFLELRPSIAVLTNVDADHLDYHGTMDKIVQSFGQFLHHVDEDGCVVACIDDHNVRDVLDRLPRRVVGYSIGGAGDVRALDVSVDTPRASYELVRGGDRLGRVTLGVPGVHNVANSLAAAAVGFEFGVRFDEVREALARFNGTGRRFETLATVDGIMVVDDYAHHPREIEATLAAARSGWNRRVVAVFQPHLYSRTRIFAREFAESLSAADLVVVTDIYAARERPIEGVTAAMILPHIEGPEVHYIPDKSEVAGFLLPRLRGGDMVITLGAGDVRTVGEDIVQALSGAKPAAAATGIKS